jgi:uncharacterized protein (TIGR02301 family)
MLKRVVVACGLLILVAQPFAVAASDKDKEQPAKVAVPPAPPAQQDARPYDGQILRLSEILGALTYLRNLCGDNDSETWRKRMQALLDAEGTTTTRRDRLAGAFNSGMSGYQISYKVCTPNAQLVIDRFLKEAAQIAKSVETRYGAS